MKDKKIEKDITEVVKLTEKLNTLVLKLRKQDVSIMFDIDHSMPYEKQISNAINQYNDIADTFTNDFTLFDSLSGGNDLIPTLEKIVSS